MSLVEQGSFDPVKRIHRWTQHVAFPDGQRLVIRRTLRHWRPSELAEMLAHAGWTHTLPPVDQAGRPINEASRLYIGRLGRPVG